MEKVNDDEVFTIVDVAIVIRQNLRLLVLLPVLFAILALALSYLVTPRYTARAVLLPPQQGSNSAAAALQSLGAIAGIATSGVKSSIDQYVALMQSAKVSDRIIEAHKLKDVYGSATTQESRNALAKNVRIAAGKKDGLITVEVDDVEPARAAAVANGYVEELRRLTDELAVTEAQQRRAFFEAQFNEARTKLAAAEQDLQASGIDEGALRGEPRVAADAYAALKARLTAAEINLAALKASMTESAPQVRQARANVAAIQAELIKLKGPDSEQNKSGYIAKYREFKYQEALFELFARQFELAKIDEGREGALVQAVDVADVPERKSSPKRLLIAGVAFAATLVMCVLFVFFRESWRQVSSSDKYRTKFASLS